MLMPPEQLTEGKKLIIHSGSGRGHYRISTLWSASICQQSHAVCLGWYHRIPQIEWLKQRKCIVSQFWKLQFQIKVCQGEFLVGTLSLVSVQLTFPCVSHDLFSLHQQKERHFSISSLFYQIRPQSYQIRVPLLWLYLTLITSLKGLSLKTVILGARAPHKSTGQTQISPHQSLMKQGKAC